MPTVPHMARPKEFDPSEAMKEAMGAFWENGYHATSMNDLLSEMKLNRGSLYDTFGDKKTLFLAALAEYERQARQAFAAILEKPGSAKAAIRQWVATAADTCTGDAGQRGCLGLKAAVEMAPHDPDVANWVREITRARELMVAKVIKRGQAEGEINGGLDARVVARYLLMSLAGLKIMGVSSPSPRDVREVVSLILRVLDEA
jgi:TetR/AcrR family transcriptional repressor of nem operon